jgi:chemotaxis protein CheY-P-specific phosphatase CheC
MKDFILSQEEIEALLEVVDDEDDYVEKDIRGKCSEAFIAIFKDELKTNLEGLLGGNFSVYLENFEILNNKTFNVVVPTVVDTFTVKNEGGQGNGMILSSLKLAATFTDLILGGEGINVDETEDIEDTLNAFSEIVSNVLGSTSKEYTQKYKEKLSFERHTSHISHKSPGEKLDISKYNYLYTFVICKDNVKDTNLTAPIFVYLDKFFDSLPVDEEENISKDIKISKKEFVWWLKGFVEGKRSLDENDLKLLKQKLEIF